MTKTFTFHIDPGHGWLKVQLTDCRELALALTDFSKYSYLGHEGAIYLEEDCDAPKFIRAFEAKYSAKPVIRDSHSNSDSFIRRLRRNA